MATLCHSSGLRGTRVVVESGDFITTSGIYRMNDHPGREITLIYGDAVPTFQGKKVTFRLIRAAKNPGRG